MCFTIIVVSWHLSVSLWKSFVFPCSCYIFLLSFLHFLQPQKRLWSLSFPYTFLFLPWLQCYNKAAFLNWGFLFCGHFVSFCDSLHELLYLFRLLTVSLWSYDILALLHLNLVAFWKCLCLCGSFVQLVVTFASKFLTVFILWINFSIKKMPHWTSGRCT